MSHPKRSGKRAKTRAACEAMPEGTLREMKDAVKKSLTERGAYGREFFYRKKGGAAP